MKFNYWFYLFTLIVTGICSYYFLRTRHIAANLISVTGIVEEMQTSVRRNGDVITIKIKEYPGTHFVRTYGGVIHGYFKSSINIYAKGNNSGYTMNVLKPEAERNVIFYVREQDWRKKEQEIPYFYIRSNLNQFSTRSYYADIFFYIKDQVNLVYAFLFVVSLFLLFKSIPDKYINENTINIRTLSYLAYILMGLLFGIF